MIDQIEFQRVDKKSNFLLSLKIIFKEQGIIKVGIKAGEHVCTRGTCSDGAITCI